MSHRAGKSLRAYVFHTRANSRTSDRRLWPSRSSGASRSDLAPSVLHTRTCFDSLPLPDAPISQHWRAISGFDHLDVKVARRGIAPRRLPCPRYSAHALPAPVNRDAPARTHACPHTRISNRSRPVKGSPRLFPNSYRFHTLGSDYPKHTPTRLRT